MCEQYWPEKVNATLNLGYNLSVTLTSSLPFAEYEIRKLVLKDVCKRCSARKHSAVDKYSSVNILPTSRSLILVKPPCKWLSCTTWGGLIMVCQPMLSPWSTSSGRWGRSTHPSTSLLSWSTVVLVWGGLVPLLCWIAWCRGLRLRGMWISMNSWKSWECSECWWCRLRYTLFSLTYPLYYFYDGFW